jgi:hypothetical protein
MQQRRRGVRVGKRKKVIVARRQPRIASAKQVLAARASRRAKAGTPSSGKGWLDKWGQDHLALLSDPCGAPLVPGVYPGVSGSQYIRTRTNVNPGPSVTDGVLYFCPSGASIAGYEYFYASVNSPGTSPSTIYAGVLGGLTSGAGFVRFRCLAACVKLRYTGSNLNRGGTVSRTIVEDNPLLLGTAGGAASTVPSVPSLTSSWPTVNNMADGSNFEVRWLPGQADTMWIENVQSAENPGGVPYAVPFGNSVALAFNGVPAGSCYWEITAVLEVIPASEGAGAQTGVVATVSAPRSVNTVNDILRAIGNIVKWATTPETLMRMQSVGRQIVKYAPAVVSAIM